MTAAEIARALHGTRCGKWWRVRCPVHDSHHPTLALRDGDLALIVKCHAGCEREDILAELERQGLYRPCDRAQQEFTKARPNREHVAKDDREHVAKMRGLALEMWNKALPAARAPLLSAYLRSRGITIEPPATLRLLPSCRHISVDGKVTTWPALLARVDNLAGELVAIQRTWLKPDGTGKASVEPDRKTLASLDGGAVHLADVGAALAIAEGVETALSVIQATGVATWATLSHTNFRSVQLPFDVGDVLFVGDNDEKPQAQRELHRSVHLAANRFRSEARRVRFWMAPKAGWDFNDLLIHARS